MFLSTVPSWTGPSFGLKALRPVYMACCIVSNHSFAWKVRGHLNGTKFGLLNRSPVGLRYTSFCALMRLLQRQAVL